MKQRWVIGLVAVSLLAGAGARSSARAAWSGFNGRIAFMAGERALYSIAPDGSDRQTLLGPDTADSHSRSGAVWSRDGSAIALTQANPDADHRDPDLFVIRGGQWHDLTNWTETDAGRAAFPTWSPDGSQLMFLCSPDQSTSVPDGICRVSAAGGPVTLVVAGDFLSVAWSPDGKKIAYSDFGSPHDLYVANVDGTHPEIVGNALAGLDWSPDGTHLAGNDDDAVESVDIADHSASYLDAGSQPSWSPDGKSIAFDAVFGQSYDLVIASADGSDARLVEDPATGQPIAGMQPRWLIGQPPPRPNPPAVTGRPSITGTAK